MGAQAAIRGAQHPCPPFPETTALIVILKKENIKKNADEYFSCSFYAF